MGGEEAPTTQEDTQESAVDESDVKAKYAEKVTSVAPGVVDTLNTAWI